MVDKFCIKWNNFHHNINKTFSNLRLEEDFFDVTLVCDDNRQLSAHKVVLASCSEYFKKILQQSKHPQWLCLENISFEEIGLFYSILYIY